MRRFSVTYWDSATATKKDMILSVGSAGKNPDYPDGGPVALLSLRLSDGNVQEVWLRPAEARELADSLLSLKVSEQ